MDHPLPWLRYLDAADVEDDYVDFDGAKVQSTTGEELGSVSGFIVDADSARPYYLVVDAGGWFRSKHVLLPVGHVRLDPDKETLITQLSRDRITRFPGFDLNEFEKMTAEDLKRLNDQICEVCGGTVVVYSSSEPFTEAWNRADFAYPDWWHAMPSLPDRMGASAYEKPVKYPPESKEPHVHRSRARH